ncbi:hypothetical protein [Jeotgalibacillus soli]|uniref:Uncharacterized protein n=1 Tax=Jeotgalibacillus soli TaxID=889306 RepID=A0A0C2SDG2_9BACL|nr:hypothetical protein [Jeotgalibacillus soli]KIL51994.1 hypothetical protein KP78_03640 [Jeotgalibacillus soli]
MRITIDLAVTNVKPRLKSHLPNIVHFVDSENNRFIWTTAVDKQLQVGQCFTAQVSVNEEMYDGDGKFIRISHVTLMETVDKLSPSTYKEKPFSVMDRPAEPEKKQQVPTNELLKDIEKTLELLKKHS